MYFIINNITNVIGHLLIIYLNCILTVLRVALRVTFKMNTFDYHTQR